MDAKVVKYVSKSFIFPQTPNSLVDKFLVIIIEKSKPVTKLIILDMKIMKPEYLSLILFSDMNPTAERVISCAA